MYLAGNTPVGHLVFCCFISLCRISVTIWFNILDFNVIFFSSLSHTIFSVCWCSNSPRELFTQIIPLSMKDCKLKLDVYLPLRPKEMCHGTSVFNVLSEDPRHLHLLPSVYHWNCHYMFNLLRTVSGGESKPVLLHARETPRSQKTRFLQNRANTGILP